MRSSISPALLSLASLSIIAGHAAAQTADPDASSLVATQVREQGYACDEPTKAAREPNSDDDAVWILTCGNASYRVRLVPDEAANIEQLQ